MNSNRSTLGSLFPVASAWLARHASLFIIGVALFTFFLPGAFTWVRGTTQTVILGLIMPTMAGCVYALFSDEA